MPRNVPNVADWFVGSLKFSENTSVMPLPSRETVANCSA